MAFLRGDAGKGQKQAIINTAVSLLAYKLNQVNPQVGQRLIAKLTHQPGEPKLLVRVLPGKRLVGQRVVRSKDGVFVYDTRGTTTTVKVGDRIIGQIITLPEELVFGRGSRGQVALTKEIVYNMAELLAHEMAGHATEKNPFAKQGKLESELRADVITIKLLEQMGVPRSRIREYFETRPIGVLARRLSAQRAALEQRRIASEMARRSIFERRRPLPLELLRKVGEKAKKASMLS
jgi:hypothetical protein